MQYLDRYSKEKPREFEEIFIVELTKTEILALVRRCVDKNLRYNAEAEKTLNELKDLIL